MRATQLDSVGGPLHIREVPDPSTSPDEIVVQLTHAGVNPLDVRMCSGGGGAVALPFTPGVDGAGLANGGAVVVYGSGLGLSRPGTYAERVAAPHVAVVPIPEGVDPVRAAAIGLAGVTAWGVVRTAAAITDEDRVLVLGASGGVGTLVVQLARAAGARVWSHASSEDNVELLRRLGADEVVVGGVDELGEATRALRPTVVVDGLGGAFTAASVQIVAPGGRLVVFGASAGRTGEVDMSLLYRKAVTIRGHASLSTSDREVRLALTCCLDLVANGGLEPQVDQVLPMSRVNEAHRKLVDRQTTGRLVLDVSR